MSDRCQNLGCGLHRCGLPFDCAYVWQHKPGKCFTTTPTTSITKERLQELERQIGFWNGHYDLMKESHDKLQVELTALQSKLSKAEAEVERLDGCLLNAFQLVKEGTKIGYLKYPEFKKAMQNKG